MNANIEYSVREDAVIATRIELSDPDGITPADLARVFSDIESESVRQKKALKPSKSAKRGTPLQSELRTISDTYRANVDKNPLEAIELLGYTRRTASRRIQQAREAGLLPSTSQGRRQA
jgi:CRP-like cAMP-binding protein